jgi:hypothetical protein
VCGTQASQYGGVLQCLPVTDPCPGNNTCPPGAALEAEACGGNVNGGCNLTPPVYEPIDCSMDPLNPTTICGTFYWDGSIRGTDFYRFNLIGGPRLVTARVDAGVAVDLFIVQSCVIIASGSAPAPRYWDRSTWGRAPTRCSWRCPSPTSRSHASRPATCTSTCWS